MRKLVAAAVTTAFTLVVTPAVASAQPPGLTWHACSLASDDTEGQDLDAAGVDCADLTVPLDYRNPAGGTITVALARSRATDPAHRIGAMLLNLGGPGSPVLSTVPLAREALGPVGARFDLIGMDPRFSGRSTPIDCGWPGSWLPRSAGASRASFDRIATLSRELAHHCTDNRLRYASTASQARDMDRVRSALGDAKLSYLGYSYGTYLGAVYTQLFPGRADRIVLDSAIDPARPGPWVLRTTAPGRQAALTEWAGWAAAHDSQFHLGTSTNAVLAVVNMIYRASAAEPLRVGPHTIDDTVVPSILTQLLSDDTDNDALAASVVHLAAAAAGDPAQSTPDIDEVVSSVLTGDQSALHSAQTAIMCADAAVPAEADWYWHDIQTHRARSPIFEPLARTISPCAGTPRPVAPPVRVGNDVPALVVQAEKDINSQLPAARKMHQALQGSRMITLAGARTHGVYVFRQASCVDAAVNSYLTTGVLPASDMTCQE